MKSIFKRSIYELILACFFLSGFASLIYEVIWTRMMVLIFGATTLAVSTVLTVFMGGLALGSLAFGRMIRRWKNPLLVYAVLELAIGVYGLLIPWILPYLIPLYRTAWGMFHQDFTLFSLARFVLVSLVLVLPTTLMGGTLPVLSQYFSNSGKQVGRWLGLLYGLNTLGAVLGAFSTGYILLPALGLQKSTLAAGLTNFTVATVSFAFCKRAQIGTTKAESPGLKDQNHTKAPTNPISTITTSSDLSLKTNHFTLNTGTQLTVLVVYAVSGFCAMVYEVAWSRILSLVLGSTLYAFSAMLTTFLVGLSLGSLISAIVVHKVRRPLRIIGILQLFIGLSSFLTLVLVRELPYLFIAIYTYWLPSASWMPFLWFGIAFLMMFVPTLLLGALFPFVMRLFQDRLTSTSIGKVTGDVYASNTIGAILGSFFAGFILIPTLGVQASFLSTVYLNMLLGVVILLMIPSQPQAANYSLPRYTTALAILTFGAFMFFVKPAWDPSVMTSGVFVSLSQKSELFMKEGRRRFYEDLVKDRDILFYKEGLTATITVEKDPFTNVALRVNGRREAGSRFLRTQVLLGHLPLIFKPRGEEDIENVLVIGWGSGVTVGSVAKYPVKRIVAVELESAIIEANRFFNQLNQGAMDDPRVEVIVNDGRNYLLVTPEKYDVIISQPSLPWVTGASNLFTEEFFRLGASRLKEKGIFCQWISGDVIALEDLQSVIQAFHAVFSTVWIFQTVPGDLVLLGARYPLEMDSQLMQSVISDTRILEDLRRVGISTIGDLIALYQIGDQDVGQFTGVTLPNTDDNATVEIWGPVHHFTRSARKNKQDILLKLVQHHYRVVTEGRHPVSQKKWQDPKMVYLLMARAVEKEDVFRSLLYINASLQYGETAYAYYTKGKILSELMNDSEMADSSPVPGDRKKLVQDAIQSYEKSLQMGLPKLEELQARFAVGSLLWNEGQLDQAAKHYRAILASDPQSFEARSNLGAINLQMGRLEEALKAYQQALKINPKNAYAHFRQGLIYSRQKRLADAIEAYEKALEITPSYMEAHFNLALAYELTGHPEEAILHYQQFLKLAPQNQEYASRRTIVEAKVHALARDREGFGRP